jgi:hypothetical protein
MLDIIADKSTATCVVVECGGAITAPEYEAWIAAMNAAIAEAGPGKASAVFVMESTPHDADWDAVKADFSGMHAYQSLARVAYVGDSRWLKWVIDAFGWLTKAEEKTYSPDQLAEAVAWACGS